MSENEQKDHLAIDDLKAAVLLSYMPETGPGEPGKMAAPHFDAAKVKGVVAFLDRIVTPLEPVIATFTPTQWGPIVLVLEAALHGFAGGADHGTSPPAPTPTTTAAAGAHVIGGPDH
jgi:hypothetical protein